MWGNYKQQSGKGEQKKYSIEGNVEILRIPEEKVQFKVLLRPVDSQLLEANGYGQVTLEEEIDTIVAKDLMYKYWVAPIPFWSHNIPAIPGKRFFSRAICPGKDICPMCAENDRLTANAEKVTNDIRPYPINKRYLFPIWVYDLNKVMFMLQNERYLDDAAAVLGQFGPETDLITYREGAKLRTTYKVMYAGPTKMPGFDVPIMSPSEVNPVPSQEEVLRRMGVTGRPSAAPVYQPTQQPSPATPSYPPSQQATPVVPGYQPPQQAYQPPPQQQELIPPQPPEQVMSQAGMHKGAEDVNLGIITFGRHKGKDISQVFEEDPSYIKYLAKNANGPLKEQAEELLESSVPEDDIPF